MKEVLIFGHKNPDTDSVTSSIALSHLKTSLGIISKPMILGEINKETEFVLKYFNTKIPEYLEDVKVQIKDLNYYKNCHVDENDSISKTYDYMFKENITGVPIVDSNNKFKGLLTSKMIGSELINGDIASINTSYENIAELLKGEKILKFDEEIIGNVITTSYRSETFLNKYNLKSDTIMIVGDRHSLIEKAINSKIKLLIIIGGLEIKEEHIKLASEKQVNIIRTKYDTYHTSKLISLSNYSKNLLKDTRNIKINQNDYYNEFKEKSSKLGFNNYPVVDDDNNCLGLIRITDIDDIERKQVILVDHNEVNQSVDGLDEAEILEIIDHHKLGNLSTSMPINFRNMTVGSTNTIIYSMYIENGISIEPNIAGLMLSGIISDTLKFTSPTTTEYDIYAANKLAAIANINIDEYSRKMFKAGTNLKGKTIEEILDDDLKVFDENNKKIAISQVLTLNSEEILEKKDEYIKKIEEIKKNRLYDIYILVITDIIKNGSYIFYAEENSSILNEAFNIEPIQGFFISKCLSRKKQVIPAIIKAIKN